MVPDSNSDASPPDGPGSISYEWDDAERPSMAVIEAVAATKGNEPETLPPLHDVVDSDALDSLIRGGGSDGDRPVELWFSYAGTQVVVSSEGDLTVHLGESTQ